MDQKAPQAGRQDQDFPETQEFLGYEVIAKLLFGQMDPDEQGEGPSWMLGAWKQTGRIQTGDRLGSRLEFRLFGDPISGPELGGFPTILDFIMDRFWKIREQGQTGNTSLAKHPLGSASTGTKVFPKSSFSCGAHPWQVPMPIFSLLRTPPDPANSQEKELLGRTPQEN